jgi:dipeptide transport system ATP-binding protein
MIETPTGGELYYQGQDLLKHDPQAQKLRRQKIQIVFQNPYGSLNPRKKVGQILEEPLLINTSLSKEQRREKALAMMAKVGLKPSITTATRICSPAASVSVSLSPAV